MTQFDMRTTPVPEDDGVLICGAADTDVEQMRAVLAPVGIRTVVCVDPEALCAGLSSGLAAAVVDERVLSEAAILGMTEALASQPQWSDIPIIVVSDNVDVMPALYQALRPVANILTIERPFKPNTLVSAVTAAVRGRKKQYQIRDLLVLAETDRRKNEFLATLGHELRNPLAALRSAHAVLSLVENTPEECAQPLCIVDRQITSLCTMVDELLDVSRVIAGKLQVQWESVNLNEVIDRAITVAQPKASLRRQTLRVSSYPRSALVKGDPVRLEQIVTNLLNNALKYTPDGGHIWVGVEAREGCFHVKVQDDGDGIATDMLSGIFQPFTQVARTIARSQGGLGLGLPLVRGLAELHGGSVKAMSDGLGAGSTFVVILPRLLARESTPERCETLRLKKAPIRQRRVLVIDDNPDLSDMMKILLEKHGCDVDVAYDGESGVERGLLNKPEIAFVDIGLPILNGYEVARRLRTRLRGTRLIAVTGYGQLEDRRRAMDAGFDEHLVKPIDTEQIERVLRQYDTSPAESDS
jgi:two-component system, sensor histidine kinase